MIATNLRASSAPYGRNAKTKNFPYLSYFPRRGVWGEPTKNGKEIFGFASPLAIYIVFYHTIVSRHNIVYTQSNNYVRFIQKISFEYEEN